MPHFRVTSDSDNYTYVFEVRRRDILWRGVEIASVT